MARKKIIKELGHFKKILDNDIKVSKMIFFGSRAFGKAHRDSDIDLIVVSPSFRKKRSLNRGVDFYLKWSLDYPVDFLCYTPEEFEKKKKQISIVKKAVEEGIEIE
jgi:uncharacterized protein